MIIPKLIRNFGPIISLGGNQLIGLGFFSLAAWLNDRSAVFLLISIPLPFFGVSYLQQTFLAHRVPSVNLNMRENISALMLPFIVIVTIVSTIQQNWLQLGVALPIYISFIAGNVYQLKQKYLHSFVTCLGLYSFLSAALFIGQWIVPLLGIINVMLGYTLYLYGIRLKTNFKKISRQASISVVFIILLGYSAIEAYFVAHAKWPTAVKVQYLFLSKYTLAITNLLFSYIQLRVLQNESIREKVLELYRFRWVIVTIPVGIAVTSWLVEWDFVALCIALAVPPLLQNFVATRMRVGRFIDTAAIWKIGIAAILFGFVTIQIGYQNPITLASCFTFLYLTLFLLVSNESSFDDHRFTSGG